MGISWLSIVNIEEMAWRLSLEYEYNSWSMLVKLLYKKYSRSSSRVYCVFTKSTNSNSRIAKLFCCKWLTFLKRWYWLVCREYNTHMTVKKPYFSINQNKNIHNGLVLCNSNESTRGNSANFTDIKTAK